MLDKVQTVDIYEELSVSNTHKMITDVIEIIRKVRPGVGWWSG